MRNQRGTTLVETLVVVGLIGTLGFIGFVQLPIVMASLRVAGAAHEIAAALRLARGHALAGGQTIEVRFDATARTMETRTSGGAVLERRTLPPTVALASLPAAARLRFTAIGTADNGTVRLASGGSARAIVVNQRGRVRVS